VVWSIMEVFCMRNSPQPILRRAARPGIPRKAYGRAGKECSERSDWVPSDQERGESGLFPLRATSSYRKPGKRAVPFCTVLRGCRILHSG
jgi:hypothetical protein